MIEVDKFSIYTQNGYGFKNYAMLSDNEVKEIWRWRNDESIRKWMFHSEVIPLEKHLFFIESLKKRVDCYYWLVFRNSKPIGSVYLQDIERESGDFGYYTQPGLKGEGFGLVKEGLNFIFNILGFEKVVLSVDKTNKLAIALDLFLGFVFDREEVVEGRSYFWCDNYSKEIFDSKIGLTRENYSIYMRDLAKTSYFDNL